MTEQELNSELAHLFKILANPTRLLILHCLNEHELCVQEIQKRLHCRQAKISQHLSLLRKNDLVQVNRKGRQRYYSVKSNNWIAAFNQFFSQFAITA